MMMRRTLWIYAFLGLALLCQFLVAPSAGSVRRLAKPFDFNGDGYADLAVGVPGEDLGRVSYAGAVNVLYGSRVGLVAAGSQLWSQASRGIKGKAHSFDQFGLDLASGDFDCDGYADLAATSDGWSDTGTEVAVLYGSRKGLTAKDQLVTPRDMGHKVEDWEGPMATGDFNRDGCSELALVGSGVLMAFPGSPNGLATSRRMEISNPGEPPGEGFGTGIAGGDVTGDGVDDLVVQGFVTTPSGGSAGVTLIPGSDTGLQPSRSRHFTVDDPGIRRPSSNPFLGSDFGQSLAIADFNGDGYHELVIADPGAGDEYFEDDLGNQYQCPGYANLCSGAVVVCRAPRVGRSHKEHWCGTRRRCRQR